MKNLKTQILSENLNENFSEIESDEAYELLYWLSKKTRGSIKENNKWLEDFKGLDIPSWVNPESRLNVALVASKFLGKQVVDARGTLLFADGSGVVVSQFWLKSYKELLETLGQFKETLEEDSFTSIPLTTNDKSGLRIIETVSPYGEDFGISFLVNNKTAFSLSPFEAKKFLKEMARFSKMKQ